MKINENYKVLIVEDEPAIAFMVSWRLEKSGFTPEIAVDGTTALQRIRDNEISLVLLDNKLPDMSCREVVAAMGDKINKLPVVIVTAHGDECLAAEMFKAGVVDYVVKDADLKFMQLLPKIVHLHIEHKKMKSLNGHLEQGMVDHTVLLAKKNKELMLEIAECEGNKQHVSAQHDVTRILAESASLSVTSSEILRTICAALGWDYGEIWMFDQKDYVLRCLKVWHVPSIGLTEFEKITKQTTFSPGVGLPGRVWSSAKPIWITDVVYDENFIRASVASKGNLHAAFGFPIFSKREVLGVMVFFGRKKKGPDNDLLNMMSALGSQIGLFLKRKQAEEQVKASLREKEILLKEIHHRVKNNMQVISSLLSLQSKKIKDKKLLDIFKESQNRIRTMGQIHEDLYKTKDLTKINFANYVRTLTINLMKSYVLDHDSILLDIDIDNVSLGVDTAIPCGLIINELFTNSLKYAFSAQDVTDEKGEIYIRFSSENNKYTLVYGDNGIGMPKDINFANTKTLGFELVNTLTQQLGGSIELNRSKGTEFRIIFEVQD